MFSLLLMACFACSNSNASATDVETAAESPTPAVMADVEYQQADSIEVVKLVTDSSKQTTLDFARHFLGRPYVAYTLDGYYKDGTAGGDAEHLVVNLREFDCLTLLETCNALAMTKADYNKNASANSAIRSESEGGSAFDPWSVYCQHLEQLRYFGGHEDGYLSRIHYLSMSIADHLQRGTMQEVTLPEKITRSRTTNNYYMSRHPQSYYALKGNPDLVEPLAELEKKYSNQQMRFLPQEKCGLTQKELSDIHDGDILYIVTTKDGLDYSHQGFAFWSEDPSANAGKGPQLHMLHASSAKKKVIADPLTLEAYLKGIPSNIGVRVFRLK